MLKATYRLFLLFIPMFVSMQILAQPNISKNMQEDEKSEKPKKDIQPKSTLWYLSGYGAFQDSTQLDTLQDYFQIFHPLYKEVITATYLGNYGSAAIDNNFFNRKDDYPYFFAQSRQWYILTPEKLKFFNSTTPYTRLDYSQSENKSKNNETRFNVIHSQNITPWWNYVLRIDLAKSAGQYLYQTTRNNSVSLYTNYVKGNWKVHGGFITNAIKNEENGGITNDSLLTSGIDPQYWNVNLNSSQTTIGSSFFFANTEYRFGKFIDTGKRKEPDFRPIMGFIHSIEVNTNHHEFIDEEDEDDDYFKNTYYPTWYTKDSIRFNRITNTFQLKQYENAEKKFSFGKRAYIGIEMDRGSMPAYVSDDTLHVGRFDINYSNTYVGGGIFRETGKFWNWNFDGKLYFTGRNAGQTELSGLIYKPMPFFGDSLAYVSFTGTIENRVPDYFQERFYSNHYRWDQSLSMEQRMTAGGLFKMPGRHLEIGANYALINNFIYNDTLGIPNQTSKELLVLSAHLDKDFHYRGLHLRTRLLWQKASDDTYIHLPEWSAFISGYFQFTLSKVLLTQIGSDVRYNTKYYADAYSPATGLFYLQNEKQYGDYPYIDIYASLRLKRTRVFFKYMNVGTHFLDGEYMTSPHYPMNRATFRLGVSWAFYD